MKKVKFKRVESKTVGFGMIKGSRYEFQDIEKIIEQYLLEGWRYLGYVPIITRTTGDSEVISLIFEKEE